MKSDEIRKKFLDFYKERDHTIIPSASLVPENDPTSLFINSGMQPLMPNFLGEKHSSGTKLANFQKVIRTIDIDEVGDNTHLTFFEMMGNWSLGDYFKEDAIKWSFELLTKEFGLDLNRIYITCFEGDENDPKDTETAEIWESLGIPKDRIYFRNASENWWSPGENGPCGPDSEMFYDVTPEGVGDLSPEEFEEADESQKVVEIGNNVFIKYKKEGGKIVGDLDYKSIDVGWGFERVVIAAQGKQNVFETDLFEELMNKASDFTRNRRSQIILADHIKAAVFLIADGVLPSNTDRGYVLRKLIRRAMFNTWDRNLESGTIWELMKPVIDKYHNHYSELKKDLFIRNIIEKEAFDFKKALKKGLPQLEKVLEKGVIYPQEVFWLYSTHGIPVELTKEEAEKKSILIDPEKIEEEFKKHQETSRTASSGKFKGGLAGHGEMELKYHTATHLLHAALQEVLGKHAMQKGSNITEERLRFDFAHGEKMSHEEKQKVEDWVNDKISQALPVIRQEMTLDEAKELGALGLFEDKYGDKVSVYTIGDLEKPISRELCGGPHVENIGDLGTFKIKKEEASSAGVRRIKATLK